MDFVSIVEKYLDSVIKECGYELDRVQILPTNRKEFGDYQFNESMALAKKYGKNPREIATEITSKINTPLISKVEIAGPGFINLTFNNSELIKYLNELNNNIELNYEKQNKKIFIDYGGANVAKALHVGHLRSANIGQALYNLLKSCGYEVIGDAHLGDIGRQSGMIISEIMKRNPELPFSNPNFDGSIPTDFKVTIEDLAEMYPIASLAAKEDDARLEEVREITAELERGHKGYNALWNICKDISIEDIKRIYKRINTDFDLWLGEIDSLKFVDDTVKVFADKNLIEDSEGAKIIDIKKDDDKVNIPPLLLIKSNGTYSYETTDLASIYDRMNSYNPDEIWYVVDSRQGLHFEQVFRAAKKSNLVPEKVNLEFIGFGTINGTDGKPFKTRDGGVMPLESLIELVKTEVEKKILPNIVGEERNNIAEIVAVAAIKYADLLPNRSTDYIFDPVKFSDITGKTGTYLLYSTVRMKSLLRKAKEVCIEYKEIKKLKFDIDRDIIITLLGLKKIIDNAVNVKSLNEIAEFLYKVTNLYNNFYTDNHILTEEDKDLRDSWLVLTKIIAENNTKLLNILGIDIPEKM